MIFLLLIQCVFSYLESTCTKEALLGTLFDGLKKTKVLFWPSSLNSLLAASDKAFNGEFITSSSTALDKGVLGVLGAPIDPLKVYLAGVIGVTPSKGGVTKGPSDLSDPAGLGVVKLKGEISKLKPSFW